MLRALCRLVVGVALCAQVAWAQPQLAVWGDSAANGFRDAATDLGLRLDTAAPSPDRHAALLVLAPQYPQCLPLSPEARQAIAAFRAAGKSVYLEYAEFPGVTTASPLPAVFERLCLPATDPLQTGLPDLSILEEHSSRYLPLSVGDGQVLLAYQRVAGTDRAVFGPAAEQQPALVSLPPAPGRLLVAATALSNWQRGRYRPTRSWQALMRSILLALLPPAQAATVRARCLDLEVWTEPREWAVVGEKVQVCARTAADRVTVRGPGDRDLAVRKEDGVWRSAALALTPGTHTWRVTVARGEAQREAPVSVTLGARRERYRQAVARNLAWFERAQMLIAPAGNAGVREGFTNLITPDGKPTVAGCPRVDCISECALLFAVYGRVCQDRQWLQRGRQMLDYTARRFQITSPNTWYFGHWQSRGEFRDDGSTLYVFNDDSGAATLFSLLGYAETGSEEQLRAGLRGVEYFCHVATRQEGLFGGMPHRDYEGSGHLGVSWPTLRAGAQKQAAPHVMGLPLAALLLAYQLTGEPRYLQAGERGCRTLMERYPQWSLVTSRSCEHARMLLPLALLQKVAPEAEHRQWLDTVAAYLLSRQDPCGAIREWDGYHPSRNETFGTAETSVFQQNGEAISDQLYNTGFALMHLALAAQVTQDPRLLRAAEHLGDYLTRLQIREDSPYDGTWLRAFDFERWEYFGSSADVGWGPYCSETGWMCAPLGLGLLMLSDPPALRLPDRPQALPQAAAEAKRAADQVEQALSAPPTAVGQLSAPPSRGPYVQLRWPAATNSTLEYRLYRAVGSTVAVAAPTLVGSTSAAVFTDLQLQPNTPYTYRVVAANGVGQTGPPSEPFTITTGPPSKLRGCAYVKSLAPYPAYADVGEQASTDGVYAGAYRDRKSYAYRLAEVGERVDVAVTVALGREQQLARATHHNCGAPGYRPDRMSVALSRDGQTFTTVGATELAANDLMAVDFPVGDARFLRFTFTKVRTGASDDWLFLDELEAF